MTVRVRHIPRDCWECGGRALARPHERRPRCDACRNELAECPVCGRVGLPERIRAHDCEA